MIMGEMGEIMGWDQKKMKEEENDVEKSWNEKPQAQVQMCVKSVRRGARCLWRVGFEKKDELRFERKNEEVMDGKSGDDETGEVGWS